MAAGITTRRAHFSTGKLPCAQRTPNHKPKIHRNCQAHRSKDPISFIGIWMRSTLFTKLCSASRKPRCARNQSVVLPARMGLQPTRREIVSASGGDSRKKMYIGRVSRRGGWENNKKALGIACFGPADK